MEVQFENGAVQRIAIAGFSLTLAKYAEAVYVLIERHARFHKLGHDQCFKHELRHLGMTPQFRY